MSAENPHCLECKKDMSWVDIETFKEHEIFCSFECNERYAGDEVIDMCAACTDRTRLRSFKGHYMCEKCFKLHTEPVPEREK